MDPDLIKERQVQVGERDGFLKADMPAAFHTAGRVTGYQDRQIDVVMHVRVPHAAAVKDQRVIEQRAVAFLGRLEFAEELREERYVELVDLRHPGDLRGVVAVVRQGMMRVR